MRGAAHLAEGVILVHTLQYLLAVHSSAGRGGETGVGRAVGVVMQVGGWATSSSDFPGTARRIPPMICQVPPRHPSKYTPLLVGTPCHGLRKLERFFSRWRNFRTASAAYRRFAHHPPTPRLPPPRSTPLEGDVARSVGAAEVPTHCSAPPRPAASTIPRQPVAHVLA